MLDQIGNERRKQRKETMLNPHFGGDMDTQSNNSDDVEDYGLSDDAINEISRVYLTKV